MRKVSRSSQTHFVSNNVENKATVLKELKIELSKCDSFSMSVAFITKQGLQLIKHQLSMLAEEGIKGRILTSAYQYFNDPLVYRDLMAIENIDVRVYDPKVINNSHTKGPHHTKGYIFEKGNSKTVIIGSSNLTSGALMTHREWNLKLEDVEDTEMIDKVYEEFDEMWTNASPLTHDWIATYELDYEVNIKEVVPYEVRESKVFPNEMQQDALRNLEELRKEGKRKALLISATGTGKTYLSAFDVRNFRSKKALFVVHREQIARDAKLTFEKVMPEHSTGLLTGNYKDFDSDIVFATIQTLSKPEIYERFSKEHFNYIVIDEVHRAGAASYREIIDYFNPDFMLGMSATPERNDDVDIFRMFDHNIAYEIRLQGALEEEMIAPFHYYGLTDLEVEGEVIDESTDQMTLVSEDRVAHIIDKMKYYGHDGERVKGLIFCGKDSPKQNKLAESLSNEMNRQGLRTMALLGGSTQDERERTIDRLVNVGDIDYIITVDIFNEGIDIPEINQVVMLRPTESAIIFVQQLGRGLRLHKSKDYVVVLDFIGNYKNNFMIPIALSGDRTYNGNTLRKTMVEDTSMLPGVSSVEFDKISKEKIFAAINSASFTQLRNLYKEYGNLKKRLGRIPSLMDFGKHNSVDPVVFLENKSIRNYHIFKKKADKSYKIKYTEKEVAFLTFVTNEVTLGMRSIEWEMIDGLVRNGEIDTLKFMERYDTSTIESAIRVLTLEFAVKTELAKYRGNYFVSVKEDILYLDTDTIDSLKNPDFFNEVRDVITFALSRSADKYSNRDEIGLVIGEQYTRRDASWLLNFPSDQKGAIYGYKVDHFSKSIPLFVTYHKSDEIDDSIMYHDYFMDKETFNWQSKNDRTLKSPSIINLVSSYQDKGYNIPLFIKRDDGEEHDFYYMGLVDIESYQDSYMSIKEKNVPVVEFILKLRHMVKDDLYHYLTES